MQHHGSNNFAHKLFPDPAVGVKRSKLNFFSEHGHVAYQNKENLKCSNMIATILPADPPPPDPDDGVNRSKFNFCRPLLDSLILLLVSKGQN